MLNAFTFTNINDALPQLASALQSSGQEVGTRQGNRALELTNVHIELTEPTTRAVTLDTRRASLPAQIAETAWVLAGRNDVEWLMNYLPRAGDFSDDGLTWRGAYGPRLRTWGALGHRAFEEISGVGPLAGTVDQLQHVVDLLRRDRTTRRAVVSLYDPAVDTASSLDVPCNNWLAFSSRLGRLDLQVAIRSNDLIWGWSGINAFEWSVLQEIVAYMCGIDVGSLTFSISSLHVYDLHWARLGRIAAGDERVEVFSSPSPAFDPGNPSFGVEDLDAILRRWFEIEHLIRTGDGRARGEILGFPEPMLRSWLHVLAAHWSRDLSWVEGLEGTDLHRGAFSSPSTYGGLARLGRSAPYAPEISPPPELIGFIDYVSDLHAKKHEAYGDSWKKRGEQVSILANIARKVDRLGVGDDIESSADTAIDLLVYLLKYLRWLGAPGIPLSGGGEPSDIRDMLQFFADARSGPSNAVEEIRGRFEDLFRLVGRDVRAAGKVRSVTELVALTYPYAAAEWARANRPEGDDYRGADRD